MLDDAFIVMVGKFKRSPAIEIRIIQVGMEVSCGFGEVMR